MSLFDDAVVLASAAVDDVYGKPYLYQPMTEAADVNARPVVDSGRAAKTITAALTDKFARALAGPARSPTVKPERPGHTSDRPQFSFDRAALPYEPQRGDRLTRLDEVTGAATSDVYQVAEVLRADPARFVCDVNRV